MNDIKAASNHGHSLTRSTSLLQGWNLTKKMQMIKMQIYVSF